MDVKVMTSATGCKLVKIAILFNRFLYHRNNSNDSNKGLLIEASSTDTIFFNNNSGTKVNSNLLFPGTRPRWR